MANPALIDELEKQFRDNPRRVFARLANEYRKGGDFMRAIEICHAHVPQQPGYISGHIVLGQALFDAGELEQAQQTFEAALALDPENLIALRQLGDIARNRRDFRDARGWYTRLLEVDPQNEEIVAQLGELALAENAHGIRNGDATQAPESELEESSSGLSVAADEDQNEPSPAVVDEAPAEDMPQVDAPQMQSSASEPVAETLHGYFGNGDGTGQLEPPMLDIEDLEVEPAFPPPEGLVTPNSGPAAAPSDDDEEIAWVAAEGAVEPDLVLEYDQIDETDDTETLIAVDARDEETAGTVENDADFDLAFEAEEYETPLRPHTGESLSVIAEEDALAGVHTGAWEDRSPFGEPLETRGLAGEDDPSASFEPLPDSEIDASATDLPTLHGMATDVNGTDAPADSEQAAASSGSDRDDDRLGAFDLGEAETLVDDAADAFTWDDAPVEPAPETPSAWERPEPQSDGPLMEWEPVSPDEFGTVASGTDAADAEAQEVREESAPPAIAAQDLSIGDEESEEPAAGELVTGESVAASAPDTPSAESDAAVAEADAAEDTEQHGGSPAPDEVEASADESHEAPVEQTEGAASAFVTETMAQLYLQQGFRAEALQVYRKLAAQSPDDAELRERIADLEGATTQTGATTAAGELAPEKTPGSRRTAASFFKGLASRPAPVAPPPVAVESTDFGAWVDEALSDAGEVSDADEAAATALANGFAPEGSRPVQRGGATRAAQSDMSLNDVFGARQPSHAGSAAASMEAFFTPEGERAQDASGEGDSPEDLEAFNAWLEGLKK